MYIAAVRFADLQDNRRLYEEGEEFPRPGLKVTAERITELAGSNNRMGYPLIIQAPEAAETPLNGAEAKDTQIPAKTKEPAKKPRAGRKKG